MNMKNKLPIGEYRIGDENHFISSSLAQKPDWFRRLMVRFFFGLRWIDYPQPQEPPRMKNVTVSKVVEPKPKRRFK